MMPILQLSKQLEVPPAPPEWGEFAARCYDDQRDIPAWLDLRGAAFARQTVGIAGWNEQDFQREFLGKPWWRPERLWLVETVLDSANSGLGLAGQEQRVADADRITTTKLLVGAVALGERELVAPGNERRAVPVIHWLMVRLRFRRKGLGKALVAAAENAAWQLGAREIRLETHAAWSEAARLYSRLGYREQ